MTKLIILLSFAHNKFPLYTLLFIISPLAYNYLGDFMLVNYTTKELELLARIIQCEAGGEGDNRNEGCCNSCNE